MTDFGWLVLTWPRLDTVANWATIMVAVVAVLFALNSYLLLWIIGRIRHTWPVELQVENASLRVQRAMSRSPRVLEIKFELTVTPSPMAWRPRRQIELEELTVRFRNVSGPVGFRGVMATEIDR